MAVVNGKRPMFNADGVTPAGITTPKAEIVDGSGTVLASNTGSAGTAGSTYSIGMPLTASQAAAAATAKTWVTGPGGDGAKFDAGAPAGGFQPTLPGVPTDVTVTN